MENSEQPINPVTPNHFTDRCGLTKREYFAGLAMQSIFGKWDSYDFKECAIRSVEMADELLKQLNENK